MPTPISVVDAFASRPFEGNPAAVWAAGASPAACSSTTTVIR
jgi:predicted PhzF superfamily epimerase YddE/YHI9